MQRLFCVKYSMDANFILSGSDDGNIRLWKAKSSKRLGIMSPKEINSLNYADKLKEKFKNMPEIKRISKHRHVPKMITSIGKTKRIMQDSQKRKESNKRMHTKNPKPVVSERDKPVLKVEV